MNKIALFVAVFGLLFLFGCVSQTDQDNSTSSVLQTKDLNTSKEDIKMIEKGDKVKVLYKGSFEDGTVFDSSEKHGNVPLEFTVGAGQMIKGFDEAVVGMKENEEKTVTLAPEQAYGEYDPSLVRELDMNMFSSQGIKPEPGMTLMANGRPVKVKEVKDDKVLIDFNHELAGKTLIFWIKVLNIEK